MNDRALTRYLVYRALSLRAYVPFLVYFLQARGLSLSAAFDLNVVYLLALVVLELPSGVLADRRGRRFAMALSGLAMTAACVAFVAGGSFLVYAAANVLCALSMTLSTSADSTWLYERVDGDRSLHLYTQWEGRSGLAKSLGNVAAIFVAGWAFSLSSYSPFLLTGAFTALAAALAWSLPETRVTTDTRATAVTADLRRAAASIARDGRLLSVMAFGAVTFVFLQLSMFVDPVHFVLHLRGFSAAELAIGLAVFSAVKEALTAVGSLGAARLFARTRAATVVFALAATITASLFVMGAAHSAGCVLAMALLAAVFGVFQPMQRALMHANITDSRDRATMLSFESMGRRVLFAVGSALFGRAAESSSIHGALRGSAWLAALLYALLAAGALGYLRVFAPRRRKKADPLLSYLLQTVERSRLARSGPGELEGLIAHRHAMLRSH